MSPDGIDPRVTSLEGPAALPRRNGELVFDAPWQARAFGLAVALNAAGLYPWRDFSAELARRIAEAERTGAPSGYYERWLASLEALVIGHGLVTPGEIHQRVERIAHDEAHEHDLPHPPLPGSRR